ncbi:hypothetical protein [Candidatus Poriferisocius sp.]|uniref:hypothetical protein n=1 Tax=Candidatus Poriferisocius sp. TaxID=3101276 RepID=UPI003B02735F
MKKLLVFVVVAGLLASVTPNVALAHDPETKTEVVTPATTREEAILEWRNEEYRARVPPYTKEVTDRVPYTVEEDCTVRTPYTVNVYFGVRIGARKTSSGIKVELALQRRGTGLTGSWGSTIYPTSRFFPATTTVGKWLHTSAVTVGSTSVRIVARKTASNSVEVALQQRVGNSWGAYIYPSGRFFPLSTAAGEWKIATPVTITYPETRYSEATERCEVTKYSEVTKSARR